MVFFDLGRLEDQLLSLNFLRGELLQLDLRCLLLIFTMTISKNKLMHFTLLSYSMTISL